ncbi:MAG: tyrosine-type recombinase/integrase [Syntrophobacteraceae bacterium]
MNTMPLHQLDRILQEQLRTMSGTLRPKTIEHYQTYAKAFVRYLHQNYPEIKGPSQLLRNPHILGWLRNLAERDPPLGNRSRFAALFAIRRLLDDLADNGYPICEKLILKRDFPPRDQNLPIPVAPEVDRILNDELRKTDDLLCNAILLIRATGMRVGECLCLTRGSLRDLGANHWALHVPLGKLHNERLVPMDDNARKIFHRLLYLAGSTTSDSADPCSPLLPLPSGKKVYYSMIRDALVDATRRANCQHVRLHQLRHTYATMMLRAGISLPALKEILGHRDLNMTMAYVQITQTDLQREYHQAQQKMATVHVLPKLPTVPQDVGDTGIRQICCQLDVIGHQLEMYRRQLSDQNTDHKLDPLLRRLRKLRFALAALSS